MVGAHSPGAVPEAIFRLHPMGEAGMRFRWGAVAVATAMLGVGCVGLPANFQDPDLQVSQAVLRGFGLEGGSLDLIVRVYNPNAFALRGTGLRAKFDVQGNHVADINYQDDFQVQQGDTTMIRLPVVFQWSGVGSAVRSALAYGDLPYTLHGNVDVQLPGGRTVTVGFKREGRAPLTRAPGVSPAAVPPS